MEHSGPVPVSTHLTSSVLSEPTWTSSVPSAPVTTPESCSVIMAPLPATPTSSVPSAPVYLTPPSSSVIMAPELVPPSLSVPFSLVSTPISWSLPTALVPLPTPPSLSVLPATVPTSVSWSLPKAPVTLPVPSSPVPTPLSGSVPIVAVPTPLSDVFLLLSQCPFPSCLASFPEDYKALRLHLALEHLQDDLQTVLLKTFGRRALMDNICMHCGEVSDNTESMYSHYQLKHGILDIQLMKFFYGRLKLNLPTECPQIGCDFSTKNITEMMRKVNWYPPPRHFYCLVGW